MEGFSIILYALERIGILWFIKVFLTGVAVIGAVLYFLKRA